MPTSLRSPLSLNQFPHKLVLRDIFLVAWIIYLATIFVVYTVYTVTIYIDTVYQQKTSQLNTIYTSIVKNLH